MFLVIANHGISQNKFQPKLFMGFSLGYNFSQVSFKPGENLIFAPGYMGGIFITYISEPNIGVKFEINYSQKGWEIDPDSTESYSRGLNYIEFPFSTHAELGKSHMKFLIDLGPYVSYLQSESEKTNITDSSRAYIGVTLTRKFDFGINAGIGIQYNFKFGCIGIEGKYLTSLTNIFIPSSEFYYFSSKNQVFSLQLFFAIKIR